jgi:hypothetical protein
MLGLGGTSVTIPGSANPRHRTGPRYRRHASAVELADPAPPGKSDTAKIRPAQELLEAIAKPDAPCAAAMAAVVSSTAEVAVRAAAAGSARTAR